MRLRHDKRGLSNVIVVMLSLVILVIISANVILWSYQMNQLDWEKMKEDMSITDVERINHSSWFVAQSEYTVNEGSSINGSFTDTQAVDSQYEQFGESLALPYYPDGYNILTGTYFSGSVPTSVQTVDADYFTVRSSASATSTLAYNPSGYTLGGSTILVSGSVSNLTSDDNVYMTFGSYTYYDYDYHYAESVSVSSTTETTWQDKVTLTFTSVADAYLVMASAELRGSSGSRDMEAQLTIDGTTYAGLDTRPDETATDLYSHHFATFKAINLTVTSHTFKIQYRSSSSFGTCSIQHARIAVFRIFDYAFAESEGSQAVSGGYADKVTKTFNVEVPGEYLVIASAELNPESAFYSVLARMGIDAAYQDEVSLEAEGVTSSWESYFTHDIKSFDAGSHAVSIQARSESETHYIRRARIIVVRLTDYFLGWESGKSDSYTTNGATSWANKLVVTFTPSTQCEYLILATARVGGDAINGESYHSSFDFTLDGTEEGWWHGGISDDNDRITYATLKNSTFSEASHSLKLRYHSESWTSPDAGMGSARIIAIPMCGLKAVEVEFTGSSNTYAWTQLEWAIDSAWTTGSVSVTLQLYNYSLGDYPASGNGYMSYTSSATANTDETKSQNITVNPTHFRNATGHWKMKVKGVKAIETQFDFKADWIEFKPTLSEYTVSTEFLFSGMTTNTPTQLNFTVVSEYGIASVNVTIQVWNYSSSAYVTSGEGYLTYTSTGTNVTKVISINTNPQFYTSNGNAKIKITGIKSTTSQYQQKINQIKLDYKIENRLDINGVFIIDLSTYLMAYIQTVEIQLRYNATDSGENWYLKAYNWTSLVYSDNSFNSTTGHTPTTGWDYYAVNLTDKWSSYLHNNGTILVEFLDLTADNVQTSIDIDFLGVRVTINGALFTFENTGSLTSHLVSLWINNATHHQRYDTNIFINSGDSESYIRSDVTLPNKPYTVKVVTERGNTAVFTGHQTE